MKEIFQLNKFYKIKVVLNKFQETKLIKNQKVLKKIPLIKMMILIVHKKKKKD